MSSLTNEIRNAEMLDSDKELLYQAAKTLGFKENADGTLSCTKDQLFRLSANIAASTIEQIMSGFEYDTEG